MIKSEARIDKNQLYEVANNCYGLITSSSSKEDALCKIAETAGAVFGEYFAPNILIKPDEASINFIELMDQVVFEMAKSGSDDDSVREYIIDDLHARINLYLEAFLDREVYKKNFSHRILSYDDTIIIKQFKLGEYVPDLVSEFSEQTNLKKAILKTLLTFNEDELLNFYYQVAKEEHCLEIKSLAFTGLKKFNSKFTNWHLLKTDDELSNLVQYVEAFDIKNIEQNKIPGDLYSLLFAINCLELNISNMMHENTTDWICDVFETALEINIDNSLFTSIFTSISNILIYLDIECIQLLLENERHLKAFVLLLDSLPREYFSRVILTLDKLGEDFIFTVDELLSANILGLDEVNSNVVNYLFWKSQKTL
ncbi:MAG: hypothetical protein GY754_41770 [bacterium]|nr:hypothetical protein [bacterium]